MNRFQYKLLSVSMAVLLLASMALVGREAAIYAAGSNVKVEETVRCVVIDAGHGGDDPGKVGINGAWEKDINLQVAERLKLLLEANDIEVVMTRESDEGLNDANASN